MGIGNIFGRSLRIPIKCVIVCLTMKSSRTSAVIGTFQNSHCSIVSVKSCSFNGLLLYRLPFISSFLFIYLFIYLFIFIADIHASGNFNSTILADVSRAKSCVES